MGMRAQGLSLKRFPSFRREVARLCIGGLEIDPRLARRGLEGVMGWEADRREEQKCDMFITSMTKT